MSRVIHFEIHAENPERAQAFYTNVFGWTFKEWEGMEYWMIATGPDGTPGINGGLLRRRGAAPLHGQAVNAFVCTLSVDDVDAKMAAAVTHGGTTAVPKMPIPGIGWLAYVVDTEGNIFGIMQNDPSAK